ncbi:hypothetical protein K402DRAFT_403478 [Aulographum hederae CBS 113979]|uniref:DUF4396 domain-containing protein n=1 Tax=Aulographum hederae CBS 113979 TaxID=1176131 RepID=A0A6G1H434_9PEZI|nr:hypothetical protein K402DRAFT_403478 [Aulographum hederae CBS 113979]
MDMNGREPYHETTALIALSGVFLGFGALCALLNIADIVWRKGWNSMMWIMIVVYPINAAYMGPLTLYLYWKYGRPSKPPKKGEDEEKGMQHDRAQMDHGNMPHSSNDEGNDHHTMHSPNDHRVPDLEKHHHDSHAGANSSPESTQHATRGMDHSTLADHAGHNMKEDSEGHHMHHHMDPSRPMWATVLIGVSHCGAGCVLGDLVGEWLIYGTGATINNHDIWPMLLVDYAFALLFGIVFQYFSIAPMGGEYGVKTLWRAAKADVLSLTGFEIGLFGWMVAFQVGIWGYRLEMTTWTYWWMMQVGMMVGFVTAVPVNWWLIGKGIKEPCA